MLIHIPVDKKFMYIKKALQSHPESPQLWPIQINKIIIIISFKL